MKLLSSGRRWTAAWYAAVALVLSACATSENVVAPLRVFAPRRAVAGLPPKVVISQVFGGGGNAGALLRSDFIELYNQTSSPVNLAGWSVQYASVNGTFNAKTDLTGTIQPGGYFLIQQSTGTGGTQNLPTPDVTGTIAMAGGAGKVALVNSTTLLAATTCPIVTTNPPATPVASATLIDFVGYGTGGSGANCAEGSSAAPTLTSTTSAIRTGNNDTDNNGTDFTALTPNPRNSASGVVAGPVTTVTVAPSPGAVNVGALLQLTATGQDANGNPSPTTFTWGTNNSSIAIVSSTGVVSGVGVGSTTITATSANNVVGTATVNVSAAAGAVTSVTITTAPTTVRVGSTVTFAATARDANANVVSGAPYTWESTDPTVATIASTGVATGVRVGTTTIIATSANGVPSAAVTLNVTPPTANITVSVPGTFGGATAGQIPVGFQAQVFATGTDLLGGSVTNNSQTTWSSSNNAIATVSSGGVITGVSNGTAVISARSNADGVTTGNRTITVFTVVEGLGARIGFNTALGTPTDADPSNDYIIARRQYTLSYNPLRGGPNWVSWNLDASHKGSVVRCNCFTQDPAVAAFGFPAYDTNDWINGGVYSRGHMSPSADWNNADGDNAATFYLSNMIPQNQVVNGGIWGTLENDLRTIASGNTQVYIISGPIFTRNRTAGADGFGFLASLTQPGKIGIPDSVFKIAIVMSSTASVSSVASPTEVQQVIAATFPNEPPGQSTWQAYTTTIAKIQQSTGYNFLSALPETVQCVLEQRACLPAPIPALTTTAPNGTVALGSPIVFGTSAVDPAGTGNGPWRYVIEWGDGTSFSSTLTALPTATRPLARSKTYNTPGQYTVRLFITDRNGVKGVQTSVVTVVAP